MNKWMTEKMIVRAMYTLKSYISLKHYKQYLFFLILVLGVFFRVFDLGVMGFWGDEETSSMPAKHLALHDTPDFVSSMEYRRAMPHTYLMSVSAKIFGTDRDISYRVPSVVFGVATLILIFIGTYKLFGFNVAVIALLLLSLSEWHIILSRTARMYGPLLFFSLSFCFTVIFWQVTKEIKYIVASYILFAISIAFNFLGIIILPIILFTSFIYKFDKKQFFISIFSFLFLGSYALLYFKLYVVGPYREIQLSKNLTLPDSTVANSVFDGVASVFQTGFNFYLALIIITIIFLVNYRRLGFALSTKSYPFLSIIFFCGAALLAICVSFSLFYGIFLALLLILLAVAPIRPNDLAKVLMTFGIVVVFSLIVFVPNLSEGNIPEKIKRSLEYPFPYMLYQLKVFPVIICLFCVGFYFSLFDSNKYHARIIRIFILTYIAPMLLFGLVKDWAPPRYFVTTYPLLIVIAAYAVQKLLITTRLDNHHSKYGLAIVLLALSSGITGSHGLPQAFQTSQAKYGDNIYANHIEGIRYPDHKSLGCFVKNNLSDRDIVIAEDALQQYWYIGRVDYWLRQPENIDKYLYLNGGELKDIYVNSSPMDEESIVDVSTNKSDRIWVITSGETQQPLTGLLKKWYLDIVTPENIILNGRDDQSAVYCVNCRHLDLRRTAESFDCK